MKQTISLLLLLSGIISLSAQETGTVKDASGNVYKTVKIAGRWWMAENLRTTKFQNGDPIPEVKDAAKWAEGAMGTTPAWSWYDNNPQHDKIYGKLYNHAAMRDPRGVCPTGWMVAGSGVWKGLIVSLNPPDMFDPGDQARAEKILPAMHGGNDSTGLNLLYAGRRDEKGNFTEKDVKGLYWVNDKFPVQVLVALGLVGPDFKEQKAFIFKAYSRFDFKNSGFPIRCIKTVE